MQSVRILDGGMSRELLRLGAELKQPEWSAQALIDTPDIVHQVHEDFIKAGSDVITTNSYAVVPFHIGEKRFEEQGEALIKLSGQLARQAADAADRDVLVAGCLPPIFGSYEPDRFEPDRVQDYLRLFVSALSPYVDVWLGETLSLIAEGKAVCQAVAKTDKPVWISFTLDDADGFQARPAQLRSGERVTEAARWVAGSDEVSALLFNCSLPEAMKTAVEEAAAVFKGADRKIEIGVYANAFAVEEEAEGANEKLDEIREDLTDLHYCTIASDWIEAGASMVGGCCGIGASHIEQLAKKFK